jgi:hypothetical protein
MKHRAIATLVLVIGALASIATSKQKWHTNATPQPVPEVVLGAGVTDATYRITIDVRGPVGHPRGTLRVELTPSVPTGVTAELLDTQTGASRAPLIVHEDGRIELDARAWVGCAGPCKQVFELRVRAAAPATVAGRVLVDVGEEGSRPTGIQVEAAVERLP